MRSGRLKHFIVIEELKTFSNEFGEEESSKYCEKIRTRADIKNDSGNRTNEVGEIFYSYQKTFMLWDYFDKVISEFDRIIYHGKPYRILSKDLDVDNKILYVRTELVNE